MALCREKQHVVASVALYLTHLAITAMTHLKAREVVTTVRGFLQNAIWHDRLHIYRVHGWRVTFFRWAVGNARTMSEGCARVNVGHAGR